MRPPRQRHSHDTPAELIVVTALRSIQGQVYKRFMRRGFAQKNINHTTEIIQFYLAQLLEQPFVPRWTSLAHEITRLQLRVKGGRH